MPAQLYGSRAGTRRRTRHRGRLSPATSRFDKKCSETLYSTILDVGERSDVDYWWEDYGIDFNADSMGKQSHIIDCKNSSKAHCMHCIEDDPKKMPALWSAYVRHSRKTQTGKRGMVLEYYGGLGHHRYPLVGSSALATPTKRGRRSALR